MACAGGHIELLARSALGAPQNGLLIQHAEHRHDVRLVLEHRHEVLDKRRRAVNVRLVRLPAAVLPPRIQFICDLCGGGCIYLRRVQKVSGVDEPICEGTSLKRRAMSLKNRTRTRSGSPALLGIRMGDFFCNRMARRRPTI